jgi:hypothetical protein
MVTYFIFGRAYLAVAPRFVWLMMAPNMEKVTLLGTLLKFLV